MGDCMRAQVKRCDEMARKLRFFREQVTKADIPKSAVHSSYVESTHFDELEASCCDDVDSIGFDQCVDWLPCREEHAFSGRQQGETHKVKEEEGG
jgi:hypothetical protein